MDSSTVLQFWFEEIDPSYWFKKDEHFDATLNQQFGQLHNAVAQGECYHWRKTIEGRLAEIIVLDQFSRNIFRGQAHAFAYDGMALVLSQEAIATNLAPKLSPTHRAFLYMPYMHSESLTIHNEAMKIF